MSSSGSIPSPLPWHDVPGPVANAAAQIGWRKYRWHAYDRGGQKGWHVWVDFETPEERRYFVNAEGIAMEEGWRL